MKTIVSALLILAGLGTPSVARAEPASETSSADLDLPIALALPARPPAREPTQPWMLEPPAPYAGVIAPPPDLDIRITPHPLVLIRIGAPLDAELPRLDTVAVESYWYAELHLNLTPRARLFVQDFQPAASRSEQLVFDEPPDPDLSWDGHQVAIGVELDVRPRWTLRAAPVLYTLSFSDRPDDWGARVELRVRY